MKTRFITKGKGEEAKHIPIKTKGISRSKFNNNPIKTKPNYRVPTLPNDPPKFKTDNKLEKEDIDNYEVDFHEERGDAQIVVTDKRTDSTVWSTFDIREISELIEAGFFKWEDDLSVLNYLNDVGIIESEKQERDRLKSADVGTTETIAKLDRYRPDLTLVVVDSDVEEIKDQIGETAEEFDGFFVTTLDGEYDEVWGFIGNIPDVDKSVKRLL